MVLPEDSGPYISVILPRGIPPIPSAKSSESETELAGQAVVFTVTVNSISISKPAELNDEFVAQFGNTSVEEFRNSAIISLEDSAEATYMTELQNQAIDILTEGCEFTDGLPEGLYAYYQQQIKANFENYAAAYGVDLNTFISQAYGTTEEEFNLQIEEGAAKSTRQAMACALIAQKEGITVTDEEVEADLAENYAKLGYASPEEYKENASIEDYRDYLLTNKVIEFIIFQSCTIATESFRCKSGTHLIERKTASQCIIQHGKASVCGIHHSNDINVLRNREFFIGIEQLKLNSSLIALYQHK